MMMLGHFVFIFDEENPKQLRKLCGLKAKIINQVMSGRPARVVPLERKFLLLSTNSTKEETIRIAVKSCQYGMILLLLKLMQWLPENEAKRIDILEPLFPLPRQPPSAYCTAPLELSNSSLSDDYLLTKKTFTYGKNKKRFINRFQS